MGSRSLTFETTIFSHSYAIKLKNQRPWKTALNGSVSAVSRQNETWASAPPCPSCFCLGQVNQSELQTGPLWNCHEISTASTGMTPPVNEAHWSILLACPPAPFVSLRREKQLIDFHLCLLPSAIGIPNSACTLNSVLPKSLAQSRCPMKSSFREKGMLLVGWKVLHVVLT